MAEVMDRPQNFATDTSPQLLTPYHVMENVEGH
jgi:hypothetical protein